MNITSNMKMLLLALDAARVARRLCDGLGAPGDAEHLGQLVCELAATAETAGLLPLAGSEEN